MGHSAGENRSRGLTGSGWHMRSATEKARAQRYLIAKRIRFRGGGQTALLAWRSMTRNSADENSRATGMGVRRAN